MLRAADLIGQLADPLYPRKLNALFHEFAEIGANEKLGYSCPTDVAGRYPRFFWSKMETYIDDAIHHLELIMEGTQWVSQLYSNVFAIQHQRQHMGPQLGSAGVRLAIDRASAHKAAHSGPVTKSRSQAVPPVHQRPERREDSA